MEENINPISTASGQLNDRTQPTTGNSPQIPVDSNWNEPDFHEGGVYPAFVNDSNMEISKKYPGWQYPRIKLIAFNDKGDSRALSWIPWEKDEVRPALTAIHPDAGTMNLRDLLGLECCVRVTLKRGFTAKAILPKTAVTGPSLADRGLIPAHLRR